MANNSGSSESRHLLSLSPPLQISPAARDARGPGNPIPLSPQWLFPKAGENKLGTWSGEGHNNQAIAFGTRQEPVKFSGAGDDTDFQKKDVFRPSLLDGESGRRDRWRDEERDTISSARRDRWRDGDKEHGEGWVDRWSVNHSTAKNHEGHRAQPERWSDQTHREANYEHRRESKWNTRWGPDSKEGDVPRDKGMHSSKDNDLPSEKLPGLLAPVKDEKDGDVYRPWRLSSSHSRGRGDAGFSHSPSSTKQAATFGYSRGRGDHSSSFTIGRGRPRPVSSAIKGTLSNQTVGFALEKGENSPYKYSRAKFLFVYQKTDMKSRHDLANDFTQVSSITLEEPLDPFALCAPNLEESDVLDGIEKGEVVSSGASQQIKDGSLGKNPSDIPLQTRLIGGKEDITYSFDDTKEEMLDNLKRNSDAFSSAAGKNNVLVGSPGSMMGRDDLQGPRGFSNRKESQCLPSSGQEQEINMPVESAKLSVDQVSRSSFAGWNHTHKDFENRWNSNVPKHSISSDEVNWMSNDVDGVKRQATVTLEREDSAFSMPPPENLVMYYKDPQGEIQGPFTGSDIIGWFEAGYFGIDLQVRLANAPNEIPFAALGDVMPHLRAKAKPPPGFNNQKQIDVIDPLGRQVYGGTHSLPSGVKDPEFALKNFKQQAISSTEAENKFLESLMSGGVHGFSGPVSGKFSTPGENVNDAYLLAKQMSIEKQAPLPNPYSFWSGRDSNPTISQPEVVSDTSLLHNKFFTSSENLLQHSPGVSVAGNWPRAQGDADLFQMHHLQKSQFQNPTGLPNIRGDASSLLTPEKLMSSGLPQDPQILNLLQQQYLYQLQSQAPQAQHMSVIDTLLLLKQHQQKQEEQMHLLRQHHQQQLLSQALSEQQMFSEAAYRQLPSSGLGAVNQYLDPSPTSGLGAGNQYLDPSRGLISNELFQIGSHIAPAKIQETAQHPVAQNSSYAGDSHHPRQVEDNQFRTSSEQSEKIIPGNPYIGGNHNILVPDILMHAMTNPPISDVKELPSVFTKPDISVSAGDSSSVISSNDYEDAMNCAPKATVDEPCNLFAADVPDCAVEKLTDGSAVDVNANATEQLANLDAKAKKTQDRKAKKNKALKIHSSSDTRLRPHPKVDVQEPSLVEVEANKGSRASDEATEQANPSCFSAASMVSQHAKKLSFDDCLPSERSEAVKESASVDLSHQSHRAWKPAPGFKAKSLLEIQLEEQMKTKAEAPIADVGPLTSIPSIPWAGIASNSEIKHPSHIESTAVNAPIPTARKGQLHDLFVKEEAPKQHDSDDDNNNFIDPKESKRVKKKGGKAKKATPSIIVEVVDKSKSSTNKLEKEVLPTIPSGPSLGDFVVWKGEQPGNYTQLAWTSEAKKVPKPTSLRDIQKEQEKGARGQPCVQIPMQKLPQAAQAARPSWPSASPPTNASPSKPKLDDDLFWGPSNQSKDSKSSDFPDLGSKSTPKNTPTSRQKTVSAKPAERDNGSKYSEAMDFRQWCEKECARLIGSKDTSFLEFCLTQSRSEAELFLKENLGSYDPDHEFIEKFLNYKDMLPAGVLEMAFQNQGYVAEVDDDSVKTVGGKKKGKKGKKVSPSVLGFNVVSNRIMMGEIHTLDD